VRAGGSMSAHGKPLASVGCRPDAEGPKVRSERCVARLVEAGRSARLVQRPGPIPPRATAWSSPKGTRRPHVPDMS
jgi:hypothetical protein